MSAKVGTVHLQPGTAVLATAEVGSDFGLPIVEPATSRRGAHVRVVRNHVHSQGGVVVWFTDGTKTPPLHGRTAWLVAEAPGGTP